MAAKVKEIVYFCDRLRRKKAKKSFKYAYLTYFCTNLQIRFHGYYVRRFGQAMENLIRDLRQS